MWYGKSGSKLCCLLHLCHFTHLGGNYRQTRLMETGHPFCFCTKQPDGDFADRVLGDQGWQVVAVCETLGLEASLGLYLVLELKSRSLSFLSSKPVIPVPAPWTPWSHRVIVSHLRVFNWKDPNGATLRLHWITSSLRSALIKSCPSTTHLSRTDLSSVQSKRLL